MKYWSNSDVVPSLIDSKTLWVAIFNIATDSNCISRYSSQVAYYCRLLTTIVACINNSNDHDVCCVAHYTKDILS